MPHSPSPEQISRMQAGRVAARSNRILGFPLGTTVRVSDRTRWNNRTGVVFSHNLGEIGVKIASTEIWCRPDQLTVIPG